MTKCVLAFLLLPWGLFSQASNPSVFIFGTPPGGVGGACTTGTSFGYLTATGQVVSCVSSVWTAAGTGGGGGLTIGTTTISGGGTNCIIYSDGTLLQCEATVTRSAAGQFTFSKAAIGTTPFDSIILINPTAAAVGVQQYSPDLILTGNGWKTSATAGSQPVSMRIYVQPIQGSASPSGAFVFNSMVNSASSGDITMFSNSVIGLNCLGSSSSPALAANGSFMEVITCANNGTLAKFSSSQFSTTSTSPGYGFTASGDPTGALDSNSFRVSAGVIGIGKGSTIASGLLNLAGATFLDPTATTGATRVLVSLGAADSATTATFTNAGTTKSGGYQSSDGTAGVSQTCTILSITSFVVKNGLIVSCS